MLSSLKCPLAESVPLKNVGSPTFDRLVSDVSTTAPSEGYPAPSPKVSGFTNGAFPLASFPNCHVSPGNPKWCSPRVITVLEQLQKAVLEEDWLRNFEQGLTTRRMHAGWTASLERCATLKKLVAFNETHCALDIGSFCGASSLALAEALPGDGEVIALELEPFAVEFGKRFQTESSVGRKITTLVGCAESSLRQLSKGVREKPFDLVLIDADKRGMQEYFDIVWYTPGFLSEESLVCVDMSSKDSKEQEAQDAFRKVVASYQDKISYELGGFLILQRSKFLNFSN
jgi:caffeoyl-CoA O-methyltransferase